MLQRRADQLARRRLPKLRRAVRFHRNLRVQTHQFELFPHHVREMKLAIDEEHLYPDCSFTLTQPGRPGFRFYVELDNSTEDGAVDFADAARQLAEETSLLRSSASPLAPAIPRARRHHAKPSIGSRTPPL